MNTKAVAHQYKLKHWASLIQECRNSGKKVKDWCSENNISKDTYYYWFKEVRKAACTTLSQAQEKVPCFVQIQPDQAANLPVAKSEFQVRITISSATVDVSNDTSPETLQMVLRVLAHV